MQVLGRLIFDHCPYVVKVGTHIPRSNSFRFENYWVDFSNFLSVVDLHWNSTPYFANAAQTLSKKFRQVRTGFKTWSRKLSKLSMFINNCNFVLALLDGLEEQRTLSRPESNFRALVKQHLAKLLESNRIYWK